MLRNGNLNMKNNGVRGISGCKREDGKGKWKKHEV
jgi:hypothetical protein